MRSCDWCASRNLGTPYELSIPLRIEMRLSVIIPAYNEERYLTDTVTRIQEAGRHFQKLSPSNSLEVIVVDNDSTDRTGALAVQLGCRVVHEREHNIGKVRNAGAKDATGEVLIFIDADTLVPVSLFELIADRMRNPHCLGGAVDVCHQPSKRLIRAYLALWRGIGLLTGMAQGATQFWRKTTFQEVGGYDETLFMGEDVDFYWKMKRHAKRASGHVAFINEVRVIPSPRRFDQWSVWKTLLWTNPLFIIFFRKTKNAWSGWYRKRPE